jgi:butyrate kinase
VDELPDVARVTGFAEMERVSFVHALNHRSMARKAAAMLGKTYDQCNFVVAHLGGGVTTAAHQKGRMVEVNNVFDEGCFSMDRAGNLPVQQVVDYCFHSGKTQAEILRQLETNSGVVSYLGTRDFRDVERMAFEEGNAKAKLIFDAMVYQLSRDIGSMSAVLHFDVDAIILTGGMAYSKRLPAAIEEYVKKIAPIMLLPGENEMLSLAQGALRVLRGEEQALKF